jgi:glutamate decarboxylase
MPLHKIKKPESGLVDDVYATAELGAPLPRFEFPKREAPAAQVYAALKDELLLDGNSRQNLATFCQTWVEPEVRRLMDECVDKNMIDKEEYPQTAEIESRCVHMLADIWSSPERAKTIGCSTTGSSEAAMLGGLALKWKWRERQRSAGQSTERPNLITGPVQICWHKFARYFDVEIREVPMEHDRLLLGADEVVARCDENTIGVVPTLGVTFTLQYEPVDKICSALDVLQKRTGLDIPVHVDAASGGFLAPFVDPKLKWDFRLPRVKSINVSGHKFGLAPLGCGWIVWREEQDLPKDLIFDVNYLGGNLPTFALNFSRPGGQVICQYFNFLRLGREGFRKVQSACYETAAWLADEIAKLGPFELVYNGRGGIPGVTWKLKSNAGLSGSLYDLADRLRTRGWLVPAYSMPPNCQDIVVQRILVRHGFSRDLASLLLDDLKRSLEHFEAHPVSEPMTELEAGGFNHSGVHRPRANKARVAASPGRSTAPKRKRR